jgi:hypothetical protein
VERLRGLLFGGGVGRYVILLSYLVLGFLTGNGGQTLLKGWILIEVSIERGVCKVWNLEWKRKDVEYGSSDGRATMFASTFFETLSSGNSKHGRMEPVFGMLRGVGNELPVRLCGSILVPLGLQLEIAHNRSTFLDIQR